MDIIPTETVTNKFFVLYATKRLGIAANKFLLSRLKFTESSKITTSGTSNADKIATGMYFSHLKTNQVV